MSTTKRPKGLTIPDLQKQVADQIIDMMERDGLQWVQRWATPTPACNGVSGHVYKGVNTLTTAIWMMCHEVDDPRFISRKYLFGADDDRIGKLKKGSKGIPLVAHATKKVEDENTGEERIKAFWRIHHVWHVSQLEEIDEDRLVSKTTHNPPTDPVGRDAGVDAFVSATGAVIREANAAFYNPSSDWIGMPPIETFLHADTVRREELYYGTLLHELTHWTGSPKRLDRDKKYHTEKGRAFEGLIAEMGAVMLGMQLGVQPCPREDNAAYIKGWQQKLTERPAAIFEAASAAGKAVEHLNAYQPQDEIEEAA